MDLNIRNVPESLMRLLKLEAAERRLTLRDNVIRKLTGIRSKSEMAGLADDAVVDNEADTTETAAQDVEWTKAQYAAQADTKTYRHDIVIQALKDVCNGKRLSMPAEVGPMDKSRPAHDPKTCRVYKCGMCSK
jgi:hypothetical protein